MRRFPLLFAATLGASLVLATSPGAQTVHVVDRNLGHPSSMFHSVNAAVAAAADGDVILVHPGTYSEVLAIHGKSLTIQGDRPNSWTSAPVVDGLTIADLAATQTVTVRGINIRNSTVPLNNKIRLRNNAGPVWIEELVTPAILIGVGNMFLVEDCDSVVLNDCNIGRFVRVDTQPAPTRFVRSSVHIFDSRFAPNHTVLGIDGSPGIRAEGPGILGVYESMIHGSNGVSGDDGQGGCVSTDGGAAIRLEGDVELLVQDSLVEGGLGGQDCTPPGQDGPPIRPGTGTVHMLSSTARTHRAKSPVRDDESISVTLLGEPGDHVLVFFTPRRPLTQLFLSAVDGPLLIAPPLIKILDGTLPTTGRRPLLLPVGDLGPGVSAVVLYAQALFIGGQGELVVSEPTAVTLLDQSF